MFGRLCGALVALVVCVLFAPVAEAGPLVRGGRAILRGPVALTRGVANVAANRRENRQAGDLPRQRAFRAIFGVEGFRRRGGCEATGGCSEGTCPVEAPKAPVVQPGNNPDPPG